MISPRRRLYEFISTISTISTIHTSLLSVSLPMSLLPLYGYHGYIGFEQTVTHVICDNNTTIQRFTIRLLFTHGTRFSRPCKDVFFCTVILQRMLYKTFEKTCTFFVYFEAYIKLGRNHK